MKDLPKILAVLVNYGSEQINYLEQVVRELKSFKKYHVTVIVNSNIEIKLDNIDEVNIFKLEDYQLLPLTCRKVIWDHKDLYDVFLYGENDHLFTETHIDKHLEYEKITPKNVITGLIQYEEDETGKYYPGYHLDFNWDFKSIRKHGNKLFAHFTNVHQATFILTQKQLLRIGSKLNFSKLVVEKNNFSRRLIRKLKKIMGLRIERSNKYSVKCKVNTDIYEYGGMKKMICISEFEQNLIHHLPNIYIQGLKGRNKFRSDDNRMKNSIKKLLNA